MKVYVVYKDYSWGEASEPLAAFSSPEKAQEYIKKPDVGYGEIVELEIDAQEKPRWSVKDYEQTSITLGKHEDIMTIDKLAEQIATVATETINKLFQGEESVDVTEAVIPLLTPLYEKIDALNGART